MNMPANKNAGLRKLPGPIALFLATLSVASSAFGSVISFNSSDVVIGGTPVGNVQFWEFDIDLSAPLILGANANPGINTVDYQVSGSLDSGNPSGFPAFILRSEDINPGNAPVTGTQFYNNGALIDFIISAGADLSDGLQVSELDLLPDQGYPAPVDDNGAVFVLNAREDGTGRYHPPIVIFRNDGTGQILNSNNTGVNGQTGRDIVAQDGLFFGNEYITDFSFDANLLTLIDAPIDVASPVPVPGSLLLLLSGLLGIVVARKKA